MTREMVHFQFLGSPNMAGDLPGSIGQSMEKTVFLVHGRDTAGFSNSCNDSNPIRFIRKTSPETDLGASDLHRQGLSTIPEQLLWKQRRRLARHRSYSPDVIFNKIDPCLGPIPCESSLRAIFVVNPPLTQF
jgi:hypothetical protein